MIKNDSHIFTCQVRLGLSICVVAAASSGGSVWVV